MTSYSEDDLIGIALSLQKKKKKMECSNVKVLEELNLNEKIYIFEADVAVTRNANSLLPSRSVDTERQSWANPQNSRRERFEIVRLQKSFTNDEAERELRQII